MPYSSKVAIVILNWNGIGLFPEFLPSVINHSRDTGIKIIVADNGSTDGSISFLEKNFPEVKIVDLKENHGFAKGYNLVLHSIDATYFVLINNDLEVTPGWIEACISRFESDSKIAAIQPKILSYHSKNQFEYAGAAGGFIDWLGYPFCRGRILNVNEKDEGQYDDASPVFWATGACMFIRGNCFREAGGFDEDFWAHMEEIDICWRLKNMGYSVWYEPQSIVFHLGGGSLPYNNPKKIYLNFRNNLLILIKNLPSGRLLPVFMLRIVLDVIAAMKFLAGFNFNAFFSVFRAHLWVYRKFPLFLKKRKVLVHKSVQHHHNEIYKKSIIWNFYLRGKNKFSELHFNHK